MKNVFLLLVLILSTMAYAENGPHGRSTSMDSIGTLQGPLEQFYINVKNTSTESLTNGHVALLDLVADDGFSVVTSENTATDIPHCILDQDCALSVNGAVCRCQIYGLKEDIQFNASFNSTQLAGGASTAGQYLYIDEVSGQESRGMVGAMDQSNNNVNDIPLAIAYDTQTTSGDLQAWIILR